MDSNVKIRNYMDIGGEHCTCHLVKSVTRMIFMLPGRPCTEENTWASLI